MNRSVAANTQQFDNMDEKLYPVVYNFLTVCGYTKTAAKCLKETKKTEASMKTKENLIKIYEEFQKKSKTTKAAVKEQDSSDDSSDEESSDDEKSEDKKKISVPVVAKKAFPATATVP